MSEIRDQREIQVTQDKKDTVESRDKLEMLEMMVSQERSEMLDHVVTQDKLVTRDV